MSGYGLTRLVLLNSANYDRAEIPLDDSVSIVGPNNAGKTSLINALQFLLVDDRRQMDFGAHDESASLRFYFPGQSSYILLEAQLESGMVVLGCAGKGASHEIQHFAYAGSLRLDDFRRDDGTLVASPDLREHLSLKGTTVQFFPRATEFFDALYGRSGKKAVSDLDLRLYRLENPRLKKVFQQVLVRTLRLDRLRAEDVKKFLLQVFEVEYGTEIDFNRIWHRAFDRVNADRLQYQVCCKHKKRILDAEPWYDERLVLRGKITALRPQIDRALDRWETWRTERTREFENDLRGWDAKNTALRTALDGLAEERYRIEQRLKELRESSERLSRYDAEFCLARRDDLEGRLDRARQDLESASVLLVSTERGSLSLKEKDRLEKSRRIAALERRLELGDRLLGARLRGLLSEEEMSLLHGLARDEIFDLPLESCGDPEAFAARMRSFLQAPGDDLDLWGLRLSRGSLSRPYRQADAAEIRAELDQRRTELAQIDRELQALRDRGAHETRVQELRGLAEKARQNLEEFGRYEELRTTKPARDEENAGIQTRRARLEAEREDLLRQQERFQQEKLALQQSQADLERQHHAINARRNQRRDLDPAMLRLDEFPLSPWFASAEVEPGTLEEALRQQFDDCKRLVDLDNSLRTFLHDLLQHGFTKFQGIDSEDEQIRQTLNYTHNLENENEALQREVRSAVTTVASSLKELERQYDQFSEKLRGFNQLIGKRRLSDLERFRIEIQEQPHLLEAIRSILASSEAIDALESPDLFDAAQAASDAVGNDVLDRAKDHLLQFCGTKGSLKLEHLFELEFEVAKQGQTPQRFDQLDKIGSNGTVLMAKLVSGLALLHKMLDARGQIRTICYLDEAASLDDANQESLIATAGEFGFNLLFASPTPQNTVRYCVPIEKRGGRNLVTQKHWQIFENLDGTP